MEYEKIGKFIKKLREENNMTQEGLAEMVPIGRTAVSKWERGSTMPDPSVLIRLSDIFKISINEILLGQKNEDIPITKLNEVTFQLYKNMYKKRRIISYLLYLIIFIVIAFLSYYFVSSYKTTKIYRVSGHSERFHVDNGIVVYTKEKAYFYVGMIESEDDIKIDKVELYSQYKSENLKLLNSQDDIYIYLIETKGYNEYELQNFIDKEYTTYIKIYYNNTSEMFELDYVEDYIDKNFIPKTAPNVSEGEDNSAELSLEQNNLLKSVKASLKDGEEDLNVNYKDGELLVNYNDQNKILTIIYEVEAVTIDIWHYNFSLNILGYTGKEFSSVIIDSNLQCTSGNCDGWEEKEAEFWSIIDLIT